MQRLNNLIAVIVITSFIASAAFGLCAMTMGDSSGHDHMTCGQTDIAIALCADNLVRNATTNGTLIAMITFLMLSVMVAMSAIIPTTVAPPPRSQRHRLPTLSSFYVLLEAFSKGILQPKIFA